MDSKHRSWAEQEIKKVRLDRGQAAEGIIGYMRVEGAVSSKNGKNVKRHKISWQQEQKNRKLQVSVS